RVWREVDGPDLARVTDPTALVIDADKARRFDRAAGEYRSTYYRALKALQGLWDGVEEPGAAPWPPDPRPPPRRGREQETDINAPASRGMSAEEPVSAPCAATEVFAAQWSREPKGEPKADSRNEPGMGSGGASVSGLAEPSGAPKPCRSAHKVA